MSWRSAVRARVDLDRELANSGNCCSSIAEAWDGLANCD